MSQVVRKFIGDNQVSDAKILLGNDLFLKGRNAADTADINILKVNTSDQTVLVDSADGEAINLQTRQMSAADASISIDFNTRTMYDSAVANSIDYQNRVMFDASAVTSIDYNNRFLKNSSGATMLDFSATAIVINAATLTLPNSASDPTPVVAGDIYYNTVSNKIKMYNGATWETVTSI